MFKGGAPLKERGRELVHTLGKHDAAKTGAVSKRTAAAAKSSRGEKNRPDTVITDSEGKI